MDVLKIMGAVWVIGAIGFIFLNSIVLSNPTLCIIFSWILFPDVDVSIRGGDRFKNKYLNPSYMGMLVFTWPFRVVKIISIFTFKILVTVFIFSVKILFIAIDFFCQNLEERRLDEMWRRRD